MPLSLLRHFAPRLLLLLAACLPAAAAAADATGIFYRQRIGASLPMDAAFLDQSGRAITLGQAIGATPTVLVLNYFHCPALCDIVRDDLLQALSRLALRAPRQYRLVAVSIDPAEHPADAAGALAADLSRFPMSNGAAGLRYLTGDAAAIASVTGAAGFHDRYDPASRQFIHPAGIVFVAPSGVISSYLLGVGYRPADVDAALLGARLGRLSQAALPVLLLCLHFDASTGRYSLAILRLLRVFACAFVLVAGAGLLLWRRRSAATDRA